MYRKWLFVIFILSSLVHSAAEAWCYEDMRPYLGLNAGWRLMRYKEGFGNNLLPHHHYQGDIYAGVLFNPCVGLEMGYELAETRSRVSTLGPGEISAGMTVPSTARVTFKSSAKIRGTHIDLVGFYPIWDEYCLQLFGGVGVVFIKTGFERKTIDMNGLPGTTIRVMSKYKAVARLTGGLQKMITECLAIRASIMWENTNRINAFANDDMPTSVVKPQNSFIYNIGLVWFPF